MSDQFTVVWRSNLSFTKVSTALLLSAVALPASVIAVGLLYANDDLFWPELWMILMLPSIWGIVSVLSIRDAVKRRSWRQIACTAALLLPTALLLNTMLSPRFTLHQLFTSRPLDVPFLSANGFAFIQKFPVCAQESPCTGGTVAEIKTFKLAKVPDGCCFLQVVNGRAGKHKVEKVRVVLNGEEVNLPRGSPLQSANVRLVNENELSVQLSGSTDAYVYVFMSYTGKKEHPPA